MPSTDSSFAGAPSADDAAGATGHKGDQGEEGATGNGSEVPPKILVQIHDELLFEVAANEVDINRLRDAVMRCCADECEREFRMSVPLKLKCSYGASWGSMVEM